VGAATSAWDAFSLAKAMRRFHLCRYWMATILVLMPFPNKKPHGTVTRRLVPAPAFQNSANKEAACSMRRTDTAEVRESAGALN